VKEFLKYVKDFKLVNVHAPTNEIAEDTKEEFCNLLE
jgi:hypothetical protein